MDLTWSGANSATVGVYRDISLILTTANDGSERTSVDRNGTYAFQVCVGTTCSNTASVTF